MNKELQEFKKKFSKIQKLTNQVEILVLYIRGTDLTKSETWIFWSTLDPSHWSKIEYVEKMKKKQLQTFLKGSQKYRNKPIKLKTWLYDGGN